MSVTKWNLKCIDKVVDRFEKIAESAGASVIRRKVVEDLIDWHAVCPMNYHALANTDDFTLIHDVIGIQNHIDKKISRHFIPRCARSSGN